LVEESILEDKAEVLEQLALQIETETAFRGINVSRKLTSDAILAGLTIDWRNVDDWFAYKKKIEFLVDAPVNRLFPSVTLPVKLFVQKYASHPFIDMYATECSKSTGFDSVVAVISISQNDDHNNMLKNEEILYLGDSENDNPAFIKAGISIGVRSDKRLKPSLDCEYFIDYEKLMPFLRALYQNDLVFTESLLHR
jgi:hydroxymethylpyrimidine pyrophosphatase-like HAD family hydrolase